MSRYLPTDTYALAPENNFVSNEVKQQSFIPGKLAQWYNGVPDGEFGRWRVINGVVYFDYTGLSENKNKWFYINKGISDHSFTGFATINNEWWYVKKGALVPNYTGLAKHQDKNWYYVENGRVDWNVTKTAIYNGEKWNVVNGKMTGPATYIKESGNEYLKNYFGLSRKQFIKYMFDIEEEHKHNYYLNTRYISWTEGDNFYPNGAPRKDGYTGMNCAGFIKTAIEDAGGDISGVNNYCNYYGEDALWGLAGASVWYKFLSGEGIKSRAYASKQDLLTDGWAQRGDIIFCEPYDPQYNHIGFYWGAAAGEDHFWHSFPNTTYDARGNRYGNSIGPLKTYTDCIWHVYKWE